MHTVKFKLQGGLLVLLLYVIMYIIIVIIGLQRSAAAVAETKCKFEI